MSFLGWVHPCLYMGLLPVGEQSKKKATCAAVDRAAVLCVIILDDSSPFVNSINLTNPNFYYLYNLWILTEGDSGQNRWSCYSGQTGSP